MPDYKIRGTAPLRGSVLVQGAKNSVLPMLAACLLCSEKVQLSGVPQLSDVSNSLRIIEKLGCRVRRGVHTLEVDTQAVCYSTLTAEDCRKMRSSVLFLGPLLGRTGRAELYCPGGCVLGPRPIDLHIEALCKMGAEIEVTDERISAVCPDGLQGSEITLRYPSVGATENILMAACLAKGRTVLYNSAVEPEIGELIALLRAMGAFIEVGGGRVCIEGSERLHGCHRTVGADRIVAFTLMAAALVTDGEITLCNCPVQALQAPLRVLGDIGADISLCGEGLRIRRGTKIYPVNVSSAPYPGFPTDAGALLLTILSLASGRSRYEETVFSDRFAIAEQLRRLGADIEVKNNCAVINGVPQLCGGTVRATDLRAGAALIVAALGAQGESTVCGGEHILRGYEDIVGVFRSLGAEITEIN
ncbi:MAG: UDP-N-acetylglucosamine 1-carboxyvinyltransferase [Clostridia bacterium]|nr:UDP-N-acetylglucosamine 1-carboxyvinyltransferase [Clostridia bacterium]